MSFRTTLSEASTPVYAAVGVTDLAAEKLREARTTLEGLNAEKALKQVQEVPAAVLERSLEIAGQAQNRYDALASRGEQLVRRIGRQQSTQDLVNQAEQTVARGKGAVTTVRKAAADTRTSARSTVTVGRHQAARVADAVTSTLSREAKDARQSAEQVADVTEQAVKATGTAAKRTRTTARKGAKAATARTKATTTTARKTAPRARKATTKAAQKVGA